MPDDGPSSFDPADLFGDDPEAGEGFTKNIEDFFGDAPGKAEAGSLEADRGGMSEEEWRASPQYAEFRKKVIARHLQRKAEAAAQAPRPQAPRGAEAAPAPPASGEPSEEGHSTEERKQELLEKYKAAKAATIAQRKTAPPPAVPPEKAAAPVRPPSIRDLPPLPPLKNQAAPSFPVLPPLPKLPPLPPLPPPKGKGNV